MLFKISLDYTPVKGRLHTRYAPVRRSSADCKQSLLPLDLHVLGLPLAFILSQDQTLRCCLVNIIYDANNIDFVSKWSSSLCIFRYALSFFNSYTFNELFYSALLDNYPFSECKYKTLLFTTHAFLIIFLIYLLFIHNPLK